MCRSMPLWGRVGKRRRLTIVFLQAIPLLIASILFPSCVGSTTDVDSDFQSIFDGKSLEGWKVTGNGTKRDWSVVGDRLVGRCQGKSSYLLWQEEDLRDFELKLNYRLLTEANTGIELRCRIDVTGKRPFESYHADLGHIGIGPHILGSWDFHFATRKEHQNPRGTRLVINVDGTSHLSYIQDALTLDDINRRPAWNNVHIKAKGNNFRFFINGKLSSEFIDNAESGRLEQGGIALQLHDKGIHVEFKDIRLRRL